MMDEEKAPGVEELQSMYSRGELDHLKPLLERYIHNHKQAILDHWQDLKRNKGEDLSLDVAVRLFITEHQSDLEKEFGLQDAGKTRKVLLVYCMNNDHYLSFVQG